MRRDLITSIRAVLVFTVILGLIYPFVVWGIGQIAFHGRANGSQIHVDGKLAGSALIGQDFSKHPEDFQSRPSQSSYNAAGTFFSNRGPNQSSAVYFYRDQLAAYLKREQPHDRGLTAKH